MTHFALEDILNSQNLPQASDLIALLNRGINCIKKDNRAIRPAGGGLLDFLSEPLLPTIIIPDIHARWFLLKNVLEYTLPKEILDGNLTVLQALTQKKIRVICVGDALHAEARAYERWLMSYDEYCNGVYAGDSMKEEMQEGIKVLQILLWLKINFPDYFHFLKGNHENICNITGEGDCGFYKFTQEGQQVRSFIIEYYDEMILHLISCFEHALPIVAVGRGFVVSHAEPRHFHTRKEVISYHKNDQIVYDFTWTQNDSADENTCKDMIKELGANCTENRVWYFGGHRPIKDKYALRQAGVYIQIHNPDCQNIAIVKANGVFDPDANIYTVGS